MAKEVERCLALEPNAPTLPAATMTLSADQPQFFTMGEITERLDHGARGGDRDAGWITTKSERPPWALQLGVPVKAKAWGR
jgi:hypothetical protein